MYKLAAFAAVLALAPAALGQATAAPWGQCGGQGWTGATLCPTGWYCSVLNPWYSQCLQGSSTVTLTTMTTTTSRTSTSTTSRSTVVDTTSGTPTTTGAGPGPTLVANYLWIRAVVDPNFHKYLQSNPLYAASNAVLNSYTTAGQFQVINGQLVQLLANGGQLYGYVEPRANSTVMKLRLSFVKTAPNTATAGTFQWSGDALQWTLPSISRPNLSAWLACPDSTGNALFVNLGSYGYMTPAGCYDQTIHFYNGATASA